MHGLARAWGRFRRLHLGLQLVIGFFVAMLAIGTLASPQEEPTTVALERSASDGSSSDEDLPRASTTTEYVPETTSVPITAAPTTVPITVPPTTARPTTVPTTRYVPPPTRPPVTAAEVAPQGNGGGCHPEYGGCVPMASDVDCAGGSGNGPAYIDGPVASTGSDPYDLDRDHDGVGCED